MIYCHTTSHFYSRNCIASMPGIAIDAFGELSVKHKLNQRVVGSQTGYFVFVYKHDEMPSFVFYDRYHIANCIPNMCNLIL